MCRWMCVLAFILCSSLQVFAEEWFPGTLYLRNDVVLKGDISINAEYDVVLFKIGEGDETILYPAYKVDFLEIQDPVEKTKRTFASLHIGVGPKSLYQIYEVMVDGEVSIFRRQHTMWYSIHLDTVDYDYFVLFNDQLYGYNRFKKHIYPHLHAKIDAVENFVKNKHLSLSRLNDILQIVEYYNLEAESTALSMARNQER